MNAHCAEIVTTMYIYMHEHCEEIVTVNVLYSSPLVLFGENYSSKFDTSLVIQFRCLYFSRNYDHT